MSIDSSSLSVEAQQLFEAVMRLPGGERAKLMDRLSCDVATATDPAWQKAWEKEISRRAAEMDHGEVTPIPWEDAMRTIEEYRDGKTSS